MSSDQGPAPVSTGEGSLPHRRVLFVDDEALVLEGLRPLLRKRKREWEVSFAGSGPEALRLLEERPFDAVVADLRMPEMDGTALLGTLRERWPETVRILLSSHLDQAALVQSASVSHQFLAKPCEFGTLISVVERACELERLLGKPELRKLVGEIGELPAIPSVYRELTAALAREEVDLAAVGAIVERDPGIAAKVLQLVNSSFIGLPRAVTSIAQATSYLGINLLRDMVLHLSAFRQFEGEVGVGAAVAREQGHSLLSARIAKRVVADKVDGANAFVAGMLHDIGKLVLWARRAEAYAAVVREARESGRSLYEVEVERFGVSHAEIGAYLLGLWGLPYPIVEAVANHHEPSRVKEQKTLGPLGAAHVGEILSAQDEEDGPRPAVDERYLRELGMLDELPKWRALAEQETARVER